MHRNITHPRWGDWQHTIFVSRPMRGQPNHRTLTFPGHWACGQWKTMGDDADPHQFKCQAEGWPIV